MVYIISCDAENGDALLEQIGINICSINAVKWEASVFASLILLAVNIYILFKWNKRSHKSLLTFHNVRAAVIIMLLAINSIELIRALIIVEPDDVNFISSVNSESNSSYPEFQRLEATTRTDHITIVIGKTTLANAWAAISLTLMLMWYHRVVELKKSVEFLYVSCTMSTLIFILRIYELVEIICYESVWELESSLQIFSGLCVLSIGFIDGFTVYKERYRSDYFEDYESIGYKHTLATFYSKAFFWWLIPLLWRGSKKPLELEHLGQMRVEDSARAHYDLFLLTYKTAKVKNDDKTPSLWSCYLKSSWRTFLLGGLLKLFGDLFSIIGPLAIQQIVQYIEIMYDLHLNALQRQMNNSTSGPGKVSITAEKPLFALNNARERFTASTNKDSNHIIGTNSTVERMLNLYFNAGTISNNMDSMDGVNSSTEIYNQMLNGIHYNSNNDIGNNSRPIAMASEVKFVHATWLDLLTNGWAIAWIVLLAALAQGALSQASTHTLNMTGLYIKTSLQGLIYRKTLLLNSECINNANTSAKARAASITRETASGRNSLKCNHENVMCKLSKDNKLLKMNDATTQATDKADDCTIGSKGTDNGKVKADDAVNDVGAITNLMSEDTLNIMSFFWIAHYVWAIPLKIAVVMYLLYLKLGISALIGSFVCILTITPLQFLIGKAMSKNLEIAAKCTDYRLKRLYDTFLGIKLIKLNAWDKIFIKTITEARNKELIYLNRDSLYWTLLTILTHTCTVLIVFITLSVYVYLEPSDNLDARRGFTASRLFSALALFQQLTVPLLIFPVTVPIMLSAMVSTKRLERFLAANEIEKQFEGIRNMARILSKSDASLDVYEMHGKSSSLPTDCLITQPSGSEVAIEKQRINFNIPEKPAPLANSEPQTPLTLTQAPKEFFYDADHKRITSIRVRKELLRNTPYVVIRPKKLHTVTVAGSAEKISPSSGHKQTDSWHRDSLLLKMPENVAVSVKECKFSWNLDKIENALYIDEMMVPKGKLTMIVGKSGSGKSSLLSALLMEMPLVAGDMIWNKSSTLAFVPQQPWLRNASIRDNILFGEDFRPKRYDCVLEACALKLDIALMPTGDLTMIGERGLNLSGGQRQRIAIARALYSSANVVIMDDPFASLDSKVAHHVFEQSIKKMLSKANRTVILVTQQLQLVHHADYLIVLNDGCLQASGSYKDIEVTHPHIIAEWNSIIAKSIEEEEKRQQQENNLLDAAFGAQTRTAKDRWNLFRNVAKFALQSPASSTCSCKHDSVDARSIIENATSHEILSEESDDDDFTRFQNGNSFKAQRSLSIVYGSRHLMYDIPLPIDECQMENVVLRSKRRANSRSEIGDCRRSFDISNTSKELRKSVLGNSYDSNATKQADVEKRLSTQQVLPLFKQLEEEGENRATDANLVADLVKSTHCNGGFQQFLQRMSTRKSYKEVTNFSRRRNHLPRYSADSGILSISEESSVSNPASMPPVQVNNLKSETNTQKNQDSNSLTKCAGGTQDNPEILANTPKAMAKMDTTTITTTMTTTKTTSTITKPSWTLDSTDASSASQSTAASTAKRQNINDAMTVNDCERKYGQIPAEIYLLYLRASDYSKVFIFFIAALIWQSLRVYTDVWLQRWSDNTATLLTSMKTSANVSSIEQLSIASVKLIIPITTATFSTATATATAKAMPSTLLLSTIVSGSQQYNNDSEVVAKAYKPDANFDDNVVADADERYDITYYFHIYALASCTCLAMAIISTTIGQWAGCKARRNFHDKLLQAIMNKSLHFFQVTPLGRILNRFSNDMEIIDKKIAATSQRLLQFSLLCLCAVLINVAITPWFILLTLPICVSYYIVQSFYRCSSRELQRIENATHSPIISHLTETIQGVTTIRAYNQESRFMEILFKRLEANTITFTIMTTSNRWLGISLDCLGGVIVFVTILTALLAATIACYQKQSLEQRQLQERVSLDLKTISPAPAPSLVGLVINYSLLIPIYLNWVVKLLADMETYIGSVERIEYYSERKSGNKNNDINVKNELLNNMLKKTEEDKQEKNKTVKLGKVYQKYSSTSSGDNSVINVHKDKLLHTFENNVDDDDNTKPSVSPSATIVTGDNNVKDIEKADDDSWQCHSINDDKEEHQYDAAFAAATTKTLLKPTNCITQLTLDDNNTNKSNNNHNNNERNNKNSLQTSTSLECNDAKRSIHCSWCHSSQTSICQQYIHPPISWPHRGDIYFENISLRYEGQQEDVIKNLTLFIPAGQRVGICGRTGSGKSSLALSLFGMMQITSGSIYIDGIDISQIHPDEIRTRLSIIPQDVHLFSTTIRENLDPNGHYTDIELWDCLELAQLKEFIINKMPQGLDSELIDSGIKLSLGHRQLLCLARAILKRSMCLVLDEATSYLDISTERILLAAAHKAFLGRTIITIAHRLDTIYDYDRIIVLENGEITSDDGRQQLQ